MSITGLDQDRYYLSQPWALHIPMLLKFIQPQARPEGRPETRPEAFSNQDSVGTTLDTSVEETSSDIEPSHPEEVSPKEIIDLSHDLIPYLDKHNVPADCWLPYPGLNIYMPLIVWVASYPGRLEIIKKLMARGANPTYFCDGPNAFSGLWVIHPSYLKRFILGYQVKVESQYQGSVAQAIIHLNLDRLKYLIHYRALSLAQIRDALDNAQLTQILAKMFQEVLDLARSEPPNLKDRVERRLNKITQTWATLKKWGVTLSDNHRQQLIEYYWWEVLSILGLPVTEEEITPWDQVDRVMAAIARILYNPARYAQMCQYARKCLEANN